MKLCVITCYNQPDYVRAKTLRSAASAIDNVEVIVVKNRHRGLLRYAEVFAKTVRARLRDKPDAYILTFRGYEMLLPVRLLTIGKPLIYDEFINPIEWAIYEHRKLGEDNPLVRTFKIFYEQLLKSVNLILTDTSSHGDLSSEMMKLPRNKFVDVPVGTDELTFGKVAEEVIENEAFTVFYYGNMLPLHGLKYVIQAAEKMINQSVRFVLVGGDAKVADDVARAVGKGANIEYEPWVEFEQLPGLMRAADLCLAGPFGDTFQSKYVITGKAFQYLAMGRPTVVGANLESGVFTHRKDALVVNQGSTDALVDAITWGLNHRDMLPAIGVAGRQLYETHYATAQLSHRLKQVLTRLDGRSNTAAHADKK